MLLYNYIIIRMGSDKANKIDKGILEALVALGEMILRVRRFYESFVEAGGNKQDPLVHAIKSRMFYFKTMLENPSHYYNANYKRLIRDMERELENFFRIGEEKILILYP
jgi:hypothetical protein